MSTDRFDVYVRRDHKGGQPIWSLSLSDCSWETAYRTAAWLREIEGETCKIEPRGRPPTHDPSLGLPQP